MPSKEYEFLVKQKNLSQYAGRWIAVVGETLFVGGSLKEVVDKSKHQFPKNEPHVMFVPRREKLVL